MPAVFFILSYLAFPVVGPRPRGVQCGMKITAFSRYTMPVEAAQTAELREPVKSSPRLSKNSHFHLSYHSWIVLK